MNREEIIAKLRENEATLRERGVAHAALFVAPRARGDQRPAGGDTDISVEQFDLTARITVFELCRFKEITAAQLFGDALTW